MKEELELSVTKGRNTQGAKNSFRKCNSKGIPHIELCRGKKYGEIWFETPCDIAFNPKQAFGLREWYESYWLKRRTHKGLHPYRFSIGPTAIWFKFTLDDLDLVKEQLIKLTWEHAAGESRELSQIKDASNRIFWNYAKKYFEKSKSMRREIGQKVYL